MIERFVMKRRVLSKKRSSRLFKKTANRTHKKNLSAVPLRGGWSL